MADNEKDLLREATNAAKNAYSPYSRFRVGAAVLTKAGRVYSACNVENASYGLSICAERAAVFAAVAAEGPETKIQAIGIACVGDGTCSPCGACRQVISEFGSDAIVIFRDGVKTHRTTAAKLLPESFHLP